MAAPKRQGAGWGRWGRPTRVADVGSPSLPAWHSSLFALHHTRCAFSLLLHSCLHGWPGQGNLQQAPVKTSLAHKIRAAFLGQQTQTEAGPSFYQVCALELTPVCCATSLSTSPSNCCSRASRAATASTSA